MQFELYREVGTGQKAEIDQAKILEVQELTRHGDPVCWLVLDGEPKVLVRDPKRDVGQQVIDARREAEKQKPPVPTPETPPVG